MQKLLFVFVILLVGCRSQSATYGLGCSDNHGNVELIHLGREDLADGFPYTINVYLPPCYSIEGEREYPILYLFPGRSSNPTTWFDAGVADVADQLIVAGEIPPFIMVGLENVEGDLMASNFAENIFPYVEANHRILDGAKYHAIGGGSMGGAPSYRMAFRIPEKFSSAALFGSGIILGEEERVREWLNQIPEDQLPRVFLNTGYQDDLLIPRAHELAAILLEYGIHPYEIYSEGGHSYDYWVSNFPEYLRWLAEGW